MNTLMNFAQETMMLKITASMEHQHKLREKRLFDARTNAVAMQAYIIEQLEEFIEEHKDNPMADKTKITKAHRYIKKCERLRKKLQRKLRP